MVTWDVLKVGWFEVWDTKLHRFISFYSHLVLNTSSWVFPHTSCNHGANLSCAQNIWKPAVGWNQRARKQIFSCRCFIWVSPGGEQRSNETQTERYNLSVMTKRWLIKAVQNSKLVSRQPQRGTEEHQTHTVLPSLITSTAFWERTQLFWGGVCCLGRRRRTPGLESAFAAKNLATQIVEKYICSIKYWLWIVFYSERTIETQVCWHTVNHQPYWFK